jgi:oligoribonuclease NrnB/cAMP/cGMP phosphodiesterase (DHH superfamily)
MNPKLPTFDTVIYHGNCPDGFTSAWIFWHLYKEKCEYIPYWYGKDAPDVTGKTVAIVDFSFQKDVLVKMAEKAEYLVVLDHHKTAECNLKGLDLKEKGDIIFDMNRCGAQIAWDYVYTNPLAANSSYGPTVSRPWFIEYVADRDLWLHKLPRTKEISQALYFDGYFTDFNKLEELYQSILTTYNSDRVCDLIGKDKDRLAQRGKVLLEYKTRECEHYARVAKPTKFIVAGKTHNVYIAGCPRAFRSDVGNIICSSRNCDFAAVYWYDYGTQQWWVSLRASKDSTSDLSEITSHLPSGGGHAKAAGFVIHEKDGHNLNTYFKQIERRPEN